MSFIRSVLYRRFHCIVNPYSIHTVYIPIRYIVSLATPFTKTVRLTNKPYYVYVVMRSLVVHSYAHHSLEELLSQYRQCHAVAPARYRHSCMSMSGGDGLPPNPIATEHAQEERLTHWGGPGEAMSGYELSEHFQRSGHTVRT